MLVRVTDQDTTGLDTSVFTEEQSFCLCLEYNPSLFLAQLLHLIHGPKLLAFTQKMPRRYHRNIFQMIGFSGDTSSADLVNKVISNQEIQCLYSEGWKRRLRYSEYDDHLYWSWLISDFYIHASSFHTGTWAGTWVQWSGSNLWSVAGDL